MDRATPEVSHFFENILWGTDGAMYRLCDYEASLGHVPGARFLGLRKQGKLVALRILLKKRISWKSESLQAFYHGLLCVDPREQNQGYGKALVERTLDYIEQRSEPRTIIYSFIEAGNHRSKRIAESLGYKRLGTFFATWFSRLHPKKSIRISPLSARDIPELLNRLDHQYQDHALTDFSTSVQQDSYRVLRDNTRMIAGLQADPQRWVFESLGGTGGFVAVKVLPHIPVLGNLFNPQNFRFLKVGNVFFSPGHADAASELLEATLAGSALKVAVLFIDKNSSAYKEWLSKSKLGLLNSLAEVEVHVMARFHGFSTEEITDFANRPLAISPIDL
jgi:GNAT superfamily N-acetyltransferase